MHRGAKNPPTEEEILIAANGSLADPREFKPTEQLAQVYVTHRNNVSAYAEKMKAAGNPTWTLPKLPPYTRTILREAGKL